MKTIHLSPNRTELVPISLWLEPEYQEDTVAELKDSITRSEIRGDEKKAREQKGYLRCFLDFFELNKDYPDLR